MEGFEGLMYPESKLLKGKEMATRRQNNGGDGATDRFDIDKYINSDFELVAEASLHPFAVPTQSALLQQNKNKRAEKLEGFMTPNSNDQFQSPSKNKQHMLTQSDDVERTSPGKLSSLEVSSPANFKLDVETEKMKQQINQNDTNEGAKNMIKCLIQVGLEQHNVNSNIKPDEVYDMLDPDQLQIFRDSIEWSLIKSVDGKLSPRKSLMKNSIGGTSSASNLNFELGNYPMKPWINSKDNPDQTNYRVDQVKLQTFFLPPRPKDDLFVVKYAVHEPKLEVTP